MKKIIKNVDLAVSSSVLYILLVGAILVFAMGYDPWESNDLVGKAAYTPVQVYGTIFPDLPDETDISFRINGITIASTTLKNNSYGYDPEVYFEMDNPITSKIEGYAEGYIVGVYIEGVQVAEFSYFDPWATEKNINVPASIREEVATKAAQSDIERECAANWQCEGWDACISGIQKRNCIDLNGCGYDWDKPDEERGCTVSPTLEAALATASNMFSFEVIVLISLMVLLIAYVIILLVRGRGLEPEK
ncbi:hypothetical protein KY332_02915 [Candidatus Woesearchaeota archaeon]|nr:hypothetical protein [Candidatus Woesearchaeota archaeon]